MSAKEWQLLSKALNRSLLSPPLSLSFLLVLFCLWEGWGEKLRRAELAPQTLTCALLHIFIKGTPSPCLFFFMLLCLFNRGTMV